MAPCSRCERNGLECRTLPESKRCGECVKSGYMKCDVSGLSPHEWDLLTQEEARLEAEEEAAAVAEQEAFRRRMDIRKRQKELRERGSEMLRRGLRTLDELDAVEERERLEKERERIALVGQGQGVVASIVAASSAVGFPSSAASFELPPMSDSELAAWWAAEGSPGGTSPNPLGSSGS
jgi:hypothetical protein